MRYKPYRVQKTSEIGWIGDYPAHWHLTRVKFEAYVKARVGWHGLKSDDFTEEGPYLITGTDFQSSNINWSNCYHCDIFRYKQDPYIQLKNGDLLITKDGTIGKLALVSGLLSNEYATLNSGIFVTRPLKSNFHPEFYFWLLQSSVFSDFVNYNKTGSTIVHLYQDTFVNFSYASPEINEQYKISLFLFHETAKIDSLIEKQQQLIELLKEKRQAVISHAMTKGLNPDVPMKDSGVEWLGYIPEHWEMKSLKYVLKAIGDVDHYMPKSVDEGIPYVMTGDLLGLASEINFEQCKHVSRKDYLNLSKKIKCSYGDVIMARYATIGTVSYIDLNKEFLLSYSCVTIKPNTSKILGLYLYYYFQSNSFSKGIQYQINTNTQSNVGITDLNKIKIIFTSIDEQQKTIDKIQSEINKLDKLSNKSLQAVALMQERRTALISAAVTGKIDVRHWHAPAEQTTTEAEVAV